MATVIVYPNQNLQQQLSTTNTTYEFSGTYDLGGNSVIVPSGCILKFIGGTIITNGTLSLNSTFFEGAKHCIRTLVSGNQYELDTDVFDLTQTNKSAIMQSIVDTATCIQLHGRLSNVFNNITIENDTEFTDDPNDHVEKPKIFMGNGATIVNSFTTEVDAINIKTNDLIRITDLNYAIKKGRAINKNTINRETDTRLSFIIDRCRFKKTASNSHALIQLINSREGTISNCFFEGLNNGIGINRENAVNTNVISCIIISQDGANITNNYFSTSTSSGTYNAIITLRNNPNKTAANENKRIIISGNTIYGHRTTNCYGIDMDVDSIDCTIQGNTFDYFLPDGIILRPHGNPNDDWAIEKLVIDNNRFHFGGLANSNINMYAIRGDNFTGDEPVIITNNYVMESKKNNVTPQIITKFMAPESSYFGNYLSFGNHDYLESVPAGDYGNQNYYASRINHSRMKFELYMGEAVTQISLNNPMPGEQKLVVYVANNPCPINVDMSHILDSNSRIIFNRAASGEVITFTAIVERTYNL